MATITKEKKEQIVAELTEKLGRSTSVVFTDYRGLTVKEMNELRDKLAEAGAEYQVIKHTLFQKALDQAEKSAVDLDAVDNHPLGVAWGYGEEVAVAKQVFDFGKEHPALEILGGVVSNELVDATQVKTLAKLPSREQLLATALRTMNAPVSNFVGTLHGVLRNAVYVLNAIKESKGV